MMKPRSLTVTVSHCKHGTAPTKCTVHGFDASGNNVSEEIQVVNCDQCRREYEIRREEEIMSLRQTIMTTVDDLVRDFVYYDRKEDDELSAADLESAISCGQVTVDEIVERFRVQLKEAFTA